MKKEEKDLQKTTIKDKYDQGINLHKQKKMAVNEERKEIEQKKRERDLLNKAVATAEEDYREKAAKDAQLENEKMKKKNQIQMYQQLIMRLHKDIRKLETDKYKYGLEASKANIKYYNCLENVKVKTNLITRLQKQNMELDAKLKNSQNLYETVRADRNLHSINLMEATAEIDGLRLDFRRMLGKISTLKDEIMQKENAIVAEQDKGTKQDQVNRGLQKDIDKIT